MVDKTNFEESYNTQIAELVKIPENNRCIDCNIPNTQWTSITYGIFLCFDCTSIHRSLGVKTSFVKSVNMDKWGKKEYLYMKLGGNKEFRKLIEKHDLNEKESNELYYDKAVRRYGEKLKARVFEELGLNEEEYNSTQVKRKIPSYTNRIYEPETKIKEENIQSKIFDTLSSVSTSFIAGVKEVGSRTFEMGGKFGKNVIIPSAKMLKSQTENITSIWRQTPKKEKEVERNYCQFDDDEIEDLSKWD